MSAKSVLLQNSNIESPPQNKPISTWSGRKFEILVGGTVMMVAGAAAAIFLWPAALAVSLASAALFLHGHLRAPSKTIQERDLSPLVPVLQHEESPLASPIVLPLQQEPAQAPIDPTPVNASINDLLSTQIDPPQEKNLRARTIAASVTLLSFASALAAFFYKRPSPSTLQKTLSVPNDLQPATDQTKNMQLVTIPQEMGTCPFEPTQQVSTALVSTRPLIGESVYINLRSLEEQFNPDHHYTKVIQKQTQPAAQNANASPKLPKENTPIQDSPTPSTPITGLINPQAPSTEPLTPPSLQSVQEIPPLPTTQVTPQSPNSLKTQTPNPYYFTAPTPVYGNDSLGQPTVETPALQTTCPSALPTPIYGNFSLDQVPPVTTQQPLPLAQLPKTPQTFTYANCSSDQAPANTKMEAHVPLSKAPLEYKTPLSQLSSTIWSAGKSLPKVIRAAADALPVALKAATKILPEVLPAAIWEAATRSFPQSVPIAQAFANNSLTQTVPGVLAAAIPPQQLIHGTFLTSELLSNHTSAATSLFTGAKLYADQNGNPWNMVPAGPIHIAIPCKSTNHTPTNGRQEPALHIGNDTEVPQQQPSHFELPPVNFQPTIDEQPLVLQKSTDRDYKIAQKVSSYINRLRTFIKDGFLPFGTKFLAQETPKTIKTMIQLSELRISSRQASAAGLNLLVHTIGSTIHGGVQAIDCGIETIRDTAAQTITPFLKAAGEGFDNTVSNPSKAALRAAFETGLSLPFHAATLSVETLRASYRALDTVDRYLGKQAKQLANRLTEIGTSSLQTLANGASSLLMTTASAIHQMVTCAKDDLFFYGNKLFTQEIPDAARAVTASVKRGTSLLTSAWSKKPKKVKLEGSMNRDYKETFRYSTLERFELKSPVYDYVTLDTDSPFYKLKYDSACKGDCIETNPFHRVRKSIAAWWEHINTDVNSYYKNEAPPSRPIA